MVNTALKDMVVRLSADNPAANILEWDTFSVFSQLLKDHDKYGVTDITHPCLVKQVGFSDPLGFGNNKLISRCSDPPSLPSGELEISGLDFRRTQFIIIYFASALGDSVI